MSTETRITDPVTGGQKGSKPERFDLIPAEPLEELARVYEFGARKYDDHNWRKGYKWGLSFAAMMRHVWKWWGGEEKDPESGLSHLAHAAWHCFTLMWFAQKQKGTDSRFKESSEPRKGRSTCEFGFGDVPISFSPCNECFLTSQRGTVIELKGGETNMAKKRTGKKGKKGGMMGC